MIQQSGCTTVADSGSVAQKEKQVWQAPDLSVISLDETQNSGSTISDGHPNNS